MPDMPDRGDLPAACRPWLAAGTPFAVATITRTGGSTPRPVGTSMAVGADGTVIGSLSGGCVEGEVLLACLDTLQDGRERRATYGYSDDDAFAVGLTCGGELEVLIRRVETEEQALLALDSPADRPPPRLLAFGSNDFAAALVRQGALLGYRTTLCDARAAFTTPERFPEADDVVVAWPHEYLAAEQAAGRIDERTVLCVLTHDAKFDLPLIELALSLPVAYVGAMGSRRTHDQRAAALAVRGMPAQTLARLRSPIGLDLGALSPAEVAVSIAAEIIAARTGRLGADSGGAAPARSLSATCGPIHDPDATGTPRCRDLAPQNTTEAV
jgi:xanthine dehydrogenase accessory factor